MKEHIFRDEWLIMALSGIPTVTPGDIARLRLRGESHLCSALMGESLLSREDLCRGVLRAYGVESVDPKAEDVDKLVLGLVPEKVCRQREMLPLRLMDGSIALAMANPLDMEARADAQDFSGRSLKVYFCPRDQVLRLIGELCAPPMPAPPPSAGTLRRVLIADDDKVIRTIARLFLKMQGYQVEEAPDGETALKAIAAQPPDLLILDLNMPGMDGFAVLRALRGAPATISLPVIMLTATTERKIREEAITRGADDYLVKPFKPPQLVALVKALFRRLEC